MTTRHLDPTADVAADIEATIAAQEKTINQRAVRAQTVLRTKGFDENDPEVQALLRYNQWTVLYRTENGKPTPFTRGMVKTGLEKTFPMDDPVNPGGTVFMRAKPATPYVAPGGYLCPLHLKGDNRTEYDRLGLKVCSMDHLRSLKDVEMHMKHKHPIAYGIIEKEREITEKREEREFRHAMMEQAVTGQKAAPGQRRRRPGRPKSAPEHGSKEG